MARGVADEGPHPVDRHVGRRVCETRMRLGYSQTDLARALGLTFQQVQKYEKGANRISASKLWDICEFLKIDVSVLYQGLDDELQEQGRSRRSDEGQPAPTRASIEIGRLAPRLSVRSQKIALDLMREMAGVEPEPV